jgi:phosphopantetheinyl transferase
MEKIFYADKTAFPTSISAIEKILSTHFHVNAPKICRTENGKPYLESPKKQLFFSVSHTKDKLFIAFSNENVGLDAENLDRKVNYLPILRRFPIEERGEIECLEDFLRHWTAKESAVKWLGGTLAQDLSKITYTKGILRYKELELPLRLTTTVFQNYILSVCGEKDFSQAEYIPL